MQRSERKALRPLSPDVIATLVSHGASRWQRADFDGVFFPAWLLGLEVDRLSGIARLGGELIKDAEVAEAMRATQVWIDVETGRINVGAARDEAKIPQRYVSALERTAKEVLDEAARR